MTSSVNTIFSFNKLEEKCTRNSVTDHKAHDANVAKQKGYKGSRPIEESLAERLLSFLSSSSTSSTITFSLPLSDYRRIGWDIISVHFVHEDMSDLSSHDASRKCFSGITLLFCIYSSRNFNRYQFLYITLSINWL